VGEALASLMVTVPVYVPTPNLADAAFGKTSSEAGNPPAEGVALNQFTLVLTTAAEASQLLTAGVAASCTDCAAAVVPATSVNVSVDGVAETVGPVTVSVTLNGIGLLLPTETLMLPMYWPGLKPASATDALKLPLPEPEDGDTESQLPPVTVEAVALHVPVEVTVTVCGAGFAPA
jgi:hypothetical protein